MRKFCQELSLNTNISIEFEVRRRDKMKFLVVCSRYKRKRLIRKISLFRINKNKS